MFVSLLFIYTWFCLGCFEWSNSELFDTYVVNNPIHPTRNSLKKQKPCTEITPSIKPLPYRLMGYYTLWAHTGAVGHIVLTILEDKRAERLE